MWVHPLWRLNHIDVGHFALIGLQFPKLLFPKERFERLNFPLESLPNGFIARIALLVLALPPIVEKPVLLHLDEFMAARFYEPKSTHGRYEDRFDLDPWRGWPWASKRFERCLKRGLFIYVGVFLVELAPEEADMGVTKGN